MKIKKTKNTLKRSKDNSNKALEPNLKRYTDKFCKIFSENSAKKILCTL